MAKNFTLVIESDNDEQPFVNDRNKTIQNTINFLTSVASGARLGTVSLDARNSAVKATGTVTLSSGSGAITITINGVTAASETWATSDAATATALAADINASADALVDGHVTASAASGVVTVTAVVPGKAGNTITLATSGTGSTASGARLTGGSETLYEL